MNVVTNVHSTGLLYQTNYEEHRSHRNLIKLNLKSSTRPIKLITSALIIPEEKKLNSSPLSQLAGEICQIEK